MNYANGIETINLLIDSLQNTKNLLENGNLLESPLYGNFNLLSLVYSSIIDFYGEDALEEFQEQYISDIINLLKTKIKADAIVFSVEKDDEFNIIKCSINYKNSLLDIFYLNPYFKTIILIEDKQKIELQEKINELYREEEELLKEIEELQLAKTNPLYYAKDDSLLLAKMTIQKSKYAKIIQNEMAEKQAELLQLKQDIVNVESDIQEIDNDYQNVYLYRDRYIDRLKKIFNFSVMKEETLKQYNEIQSDPDMFAMED